MPLKKNIVFLAMVMQCFWRKNHSDLIERCFESRKIKKARMGNSIKPVLIEVTSAIRPTSNGPSSMPPYPRVAMLAMAAPCEIPLSLPARENARGIMTAIPSPIRLKPIINGTSDSKVNITKEPARATNPE